MGEDCHDIVEDYVNKEPMAKDEMKNCPAQTKAVCVREETHIEDCHHRCCQNYNYCHKYLQTKNKPSKVK